MNYFKLSLKNMTAAALIAICAVLAFGALVLNQQEPARETRPAADGLAAPQAGRALPSPGKEPVMPRGFKPETAWRDPFAVPPEIGGARPQNTPPTRTEPGAPSRPEPSGQASTADLPFLAGIVSSGGNQKAIIRHKGFSRVYSEGEQVDNYRLAQITPNAVVLENGAVKYVVRLP